MPTSLISSLETLPVEILYHILDDLDAQTILFSFRHICRRFRAIVNNYDRYSLNFESISKSDFERVCYLINPRQVTSLTLRENEGAPDQIKLFLSYFNLQQFSYLRSLSLFIIGEEKLQLIARQWNIRLLESLSLKIEKSDDRRKTTTARFLSLIIAKSNLLKLKLDIQAGRLEKIIWPAQYSIQCLKITSVVAFDRLCTILSCSPHLKTLMINSFFFQNSNQIVFTPSLTTPFRQLTSLTFEKLETGIDNLELFLSLTSSLIHLTVIGDGNYHDGNRWEYFIQLHLPLLSEFRFFFNQIQHIQPNIEDIKLTIASFQTPFWLENKKWFVTCEFDINTPECVALYSIPICVPFFSYHTKKVSISTYPKIYDKDISIMDNVRTVRLDFTKLLPLDAEEKENKINYPLFRKVKTLELEFVKTRPHDWIKFISNLIDLTTVVEVKISSTLIQKSDPYMLSDMANLLKQTYRIASVDICSGFFSRKSSLTATEICSILPMHIKQLAASVKTFNEIKNIIERFQHLSNVKFYFDYTPYASEIFKWLDDKRKDSSYQVDSFSVCVWLGKNTTQMKEVKVGDKRIKNTYKSIDNESIINSITGYENDLGDRLERLEREAGMQAQQIELNECLECIAQLLDLFKRTVITSELQNQNDWHYNIRQQLQQHNGVTGNRLLDDKVEKIVINKGLTKEQWNCLLYMALSTGDKVELTKVSKKYLQKVRDKASRLLETGEQNAVFALINATEKFISKNYSTEK
ncbi:unnamed protein product [Rotaria sp. Silwood1]|nr:unnamed protein product [Rotaria sp. Silwood1]